MTHVLQCTIFKNDGRVTQNVRLVNGTEQLHALIKAIEASLSPNVADYDIDVWELGNKVETSLT